jgi:D-beta-D-heptose 7-phosphate kinase/D-beta-D-heptose 1-phosphate adenosyltransferase
MAAADRLKISLKRAEEICTAFDQKKILIYGDIILDRYIFGAVQRISPEAPVPVVKITSEEHRLGGAGNVAKNIDKLGAQGILLGICGQDENFDIIRRLKPQANLAISSPDNHTLIKTRVIANKQQIVRIDRETPIIVSPFLQGKITQIIAENNIHAIIVSDYAKGTVTAPLMEALKQKAICQACPLIIDPKPANYSLYKNTDGITPNLSEAEAIWQKPILTDMDAANAVRFIQRKFNNRFSIITRGEKGMTAVEKGKKVIHFPVFSQEVFDVTGAGDTVVAVLTLALISGASLPEALILANAAASLVIERIGTSQVTSREILKRLELLA